MTSYFLDRLSEEFRARAGTVRRSKETCGTGLSSSEYLILASSMNISNSSNEDDSVVTVVANSRCQLIACIPALCSLLSRGK